MYYDIYIYICISKNIIKKHLPPIHHQHLRRELSGAEAENLHPMPHGEADGIGHVQLLKNTGTTWCPRPPVMFVGSTHEKEDKMKCESNFRYESKSKSFVFQLWFIMIFLCFLKKYFSGFFMWQNMTDVYPWRSHHPSGGPGSNPHVENEKIMGIERLERLSTDILFV